MDLKTFLLTFVPIFVAVDALGTVPIFITATEKLDRQSINKIISQSIIVAFIIGLLFIFVGKAVFNLLGITTADFMIAGGIFLFVFSITGLMRSKEPYEISSSDFAVVPLATPLIVGPAVLTSLILLVNMYGIYYTLFSFFINILVTAFIFWNSAFFHKIMGEDGTKAFSRVVLLLLAAIAVMLVRHGVTQIIRNF